MEAFHPVNGAAQVIEHRVDNLGGSALEAITNENVCRKLKFLAHYILLKYLRLILSEACVDLHIVELDETALNVLRAFRGDFGLEGHAEEGKVVDGEEEFIRRDLIAKRNLPFHFIDLDLKREKARIRELFSIENKQKTHS